MTTYYSLKKLMERFKLITYYISFIFTYSLHSGRYSTLDMNTRVSQELSALCLWNLSLSILKRKTSFLYMFSLFANTLCPPVNKLFLSVTKFSLYISPYISFSACAHDLRLAPPESTTARGTWFWFVMIHAQ